MNFILRSVYVEDYTVMKISGCVALVTGGASGIGRGLCDVLLQRNAKVSLFISLDNRERMKQGYVRTFGESCLKSLLQSGANCEAIDLKMMFYSHANKSHFHKKGFAFSKWPIHQCYVAKVNYMVWVSDLAGSDSDLYC